MENHVHVENMEGWAGPPDDAGRSLSRRALLKYGIGALGTIALLEVGAAGVVFLQAGVQAGEYGAVVTAGLVDDFVPGSVTEFPESYFFLLRVPDGGFLALHNRCPHLGCTVNWVPADNEFICPCHAASFDALGDFAGPPVPRPLDTFPITIAQGQVRVDTAAPQRRESFEQGQLVYAPAEQGPSPGIARPAPLPEGVGR